MKESDLIVYGGRRYSFFAYTKMRIHDVRYHGNISRKDLMRDLTPHQQKRVDEYRAWFSAAGYLSKADGSGYYTKLENFSITMTSTQLRKEAYGNRS